MLQPSECLLLQSHSFSQKELAAYVFADYQALNAVIKVNILPLQRVDSLLDKLERAKSFSTLDLTAGH